MASRSTTAARLHSPLWIKQVSSTTTETARRAVLCWSSPSPLPTDPAIDRRLEKAKVRCLCIIERAPWAAQTTHWQG